MTRLMPLVAMIFCAVMAVACDDALICDGGGCVDDEECVDNCVEICDGEVFSAFCSLEEFCECECEFACF